MRKSNMLNNQNTCSNYSEIDAYQKSDGLVRAMALKNVMKRVCLTDEQIPDIKGEIRSILAMRGYKWENYEQMRSNLEEMSANIELMSSYFHGEFLRPRHGRVQVLLREDLTQEQRTIDYFGEELEVMPDFVRLDIDPYGRVARVDVGKMSSGKYKSVKEDERNLEVYALGQLGRKLYPEAEVYVDMCHLRGSKDPGEGVTEYHGTSRKAMSPIHIDQNTDAYYRMINEEEQSNRHTCGGADCAGCFKANICHYEEAPVASDIEKIIRPITDLSLTDDQIKVINFREGVARVNAGAGAGKTLTVALRIKALLEDGVDPSKIALLTFTRAGAEEMVARTKTYCQGSNVDVERITAATFNSFCMDIITEHYEELGYTQAPQVLSAELKSSLINDILEKHQKVSRWNYKTMTDVAAFVTGGRIKTAISEAKDLFATIKANNWTRADNGLTGTGWSEEDVMTVFALYDSFQNTLKSLNLMEYDDQIRAVFKLGEMNPDLYKQLVIIPPVIPDNTEGFVDIDAEEDDSPILSGYEYIIVDEFQDTDHPQIQLLQKMMDTPDFKGLMVVGDDSQSIFGFRFTSPEFIINFARYFGGENRPVHDFQLIENHRSTRAIVDFANKINKRAISRVDKDLRSTKTGGERPMVKGFYSHEQEYEYIVDCIKKDLESGKKPSSIAFLARDKSEIQALASLLTQTDYEAVEFDDNGDPIRDAEGNLVHHTEHGIPSVICNPVPYIRNSRVAALCTFFDSWISGTTQGFLDFANVRRHGGLKDATEDELIAVRDGVMHFLEGMPRDFDNFMNEADQLDPDRKDDCYQAFLEKIEIAKNIDPSHDPTTALKNFFRDFKLYGASEAYRREGNYEGVCLTTAHSSKGLEWDTTYVTVTKYDSPKNHRGDSYTEKYISKEHDEDIRLMFVAATRAREKLVITGEYLLPEKKHGVGSLVKNKMLINCFEDANRPYTYSTHDYFIFKAEQVRREQENVSPTDALLDGINTEIAMPEGISPAAAVTRRPRRNRRAAEAAIIVETPAAPTHGDHGDGVYLFDDGHSVNINDNVDIEEAIAEALREGTPNAGGLAQ